MRLHVDGRALELDDTVDRIVLERARDGTVTVTSHFGIRRQELRPPLIGPPRGHPAAPPPPPDPLAGQLAADRRARDGAVVDQVRAEEDARPKARPSNPMDVAPRRRSPAAAVRAAQRRNQVPTRAGVPPKPPGAYKLCPKCPTWNQAKRSSCTGCGKPV